ncbi:hypothetical protein VOLCADRAFT_96342 [Volvox carteri f. nagariensis]|uniref:Uncharacterized protein n=1 Tax=Volvox carteri f. nagariensis TaxID=3068 RepID=D8U9V3_VOLCA|nr:uncharacterized protein VOLCADRAFT_96342 [Volvox carteri f. nagariensis]EFJ43476.1 hypothetical protein VOLCADRAFT_96342 [Volvox carteri f. nagariensis]|eukprot:XP_002955405.1 hypothetical protein VOLCADRAFT_96342 [Volvox carteri f. nagariensis]
MQHRIPNTGIGRATRRIAVERRNPAVRFSRTHAFPTFMLTPMIMLIFALRVFELQYYAQHQQPDQVLQEQHPPPYAAQEAVTGSTGPSDAYGGWDQQQWVQTEVGAAEAVDSKREAAPVSGQLPHPHQRNEHQHEQPEEQMYMQQQQLDLEVAAQWHQDAQQGGRAVTEESAPRTAGDTAVTGDQVDYHYHMYTLWLKLQEQQQPDLEPFWEWFSHQQHQQHHQQQQPEGYQQEYQAVQQYEQHPNEQLQYEQQQYEQHPNEQHLNVQQQYEQQQYEQQQHEQHPNEQQQYEHQQYEQMQDVQQQYEHLQHVQQQYEQSQQHHYTGEADGAAYYAMSPAEPLEADVASVVEEAQQWHYANEQSGYSGAASADAVQSPGVGYPEGTVYVDDGSVYGGGDDGSAWQAADSSATSDPETSLADSVAEVRHQHHLQHHLQQCSTEGMGSHAGYDAAGGVRCGWSEFSQVAADGLEGQQRQHPEQQQEEQEEQEEQWGAERQLLDAPLGQQEGQQEGQQQPPLQVPAEVVADWALHNVADPVAIAAQMQEAAAAAQDSELKDGATAAPADAAVQGSGLEDGAAAAPVVAAVQGSGLEDGAAAAPADAAVQGSGLEDGAAAAPADAAVQGSGLEDGAAAAPADAAVQGSGLEDGAAAAPADAAVQGSGLEDGAAAAPADAAVQGRGLEDGTAAAPAEAVPDAVMQDSGLENGTSTGTATTAEAAGAAVSATDVTAAALTAAAQADASRGPDGSKATTVKPRADGTFQAVSEADRAALQAEAEGKALGPLRGMTVGDVQKNTGRRDMAAGLKELQELHELVEAALPSTPVSRARFAPQTSESATTTTTSAEAVSGSSLRATQSQQRPLLLEVAESRHAGLHAAAAATFQLAALQASGVLPPELLPHDPLGAAVALHQAARAGSLEALMALADRHEQGIGTPASCARGMLFGKLAAMYLAAEVEKEQRYTPSLQPVSLRERFADGAYVAAEDAENGEHVISLEEDLAFRGNTDAMRRVAYRRLVGRGMEADPEGAYHDFQAAAAQGDPYAIFNIGYMHLRGLYVPQNYTAAKEYFEKAAEKGLPSAHNGLGVLAWNGHGMAPNLTAAREAFERGAALNNSDAVYNLATMHFHGAGTPVNRELALELFKRALDLGHWRAPYMLALAHEAGAGTEANCTVAMKYLRLLFADRGTWGPQLTAAVKLLDAGDTRGALLTYITVAEQGSAAAAANAAWLLRRRAGYSGPDADKLAAKYFQRAAKQGHTGSMVELAHMILSAAKDKGAPPVAETTPPSLTTDAVTSPEAIPASAAPPAEVDPAAPAVGVETDAGGPAGVPSASSTSSTLNSSSTSNTSSALPDMPPLMSVLRPHQKPPKPQLVQPAALPSRRAVLGVSTAADAVAWYRAAAAAGDPEGLFYLGWANYHGVGVAENATFARMLWLRAFEVAGIRSSRALAPLLALAGMRIDGWLAPFLGSHALARGHAKLLRGLEAARRWNRGSVPADAGEAGRAEQGASRGIEAVSVAGAAVVEAVTAALARTTAAMQTWCGQLVAAWGGVDAGNVENTLMLGLLAALVVVLGLRRRRMAART